MATVPPITVPIIFEPDIPEPLIVRPLDTLIVRVTRLLSAHDEDYLRDKLADRLPHGVGVVIVSGVDQLAVARPS